MAKKQPQDFDEFCYPEKKVNSRWLGRIFCLLFFLFICWIAKCLVDSFTPQSLKDILGYNEQGPAVESRDLEKVLKTSLEEGYPVTLTEAEINRYIAAKLKTKQLGSAGFFSKIEGVAVRLHEGFAEVIIERSLFGRSETRQTVSMYLSVKQMETEDGPRNRVEFSAGKMALGLLKKGGKIGTLEAPQGYLILVKPSFEALARVFETELRAGFEEMARFTIKEGAIEFNPLPPDGIPVNHP